MGFALSSMQLTSPAFGNGEAVPARHTGEGSDVSPPLAWSGVPKGTRSLALICHDPDAPLIKSGTYGFVQSYGQVWCMSDGWFRRRSGR